MHGKCSGDEHVYGYLSDCPGSLLSQLFIWCSLVTLRRLKMLLNEVACACAVQFITCAFTFPPVLTSWHPLQQQGVGFATGLPIGLSVHQVTVPAGPAPGPAEVPQGPLDAAEGSRPAPFGYDLLPSAFNTQAGQASLSLSTGTLPTAGVTATASSTVGTTTTTARRFLNPLVHLGTKRAAMTMGKSP